MSKSKETVPWTCNNCFTVNRASVKSLVVHCKKCKYIVCYWKTKEHVPVGTETERQLSYLVSLQAKNFIELSERL